MNPTRILLAGDSHGDTEYINYLFRRAVENCCDRIVQLGDYGYWEHADDGEFLDHCSAKSVEFDIPLDWIDGNHENHTWLHRRYMGPMATRTPEGFYVIREGVNYIARGTRWEWSGVSFLGLGGAYSIDKDERLRGEAKWRRKITQYETNHWTLEDGMKRVSRLLATGEHLTWWPEEEIDEEDVAKAIEGGKVDIMLTHDKPLMSNPQWNRKDFPECEVGQRMIQRVVAETQPRLLVHGHLHFRYTDLIRCGDNMHTLVEGLAHNKEPSRAWLVLSLADFKQSYVRQEDTHAV